MLISVLVFTLVGSFIASRVPNRSMGSFSVIMTLLLGIKFLVKPVMTTKENQADKDLKTKVIQSILCGMLIGFICGFIGAGGGMMMLLILTSVLGYELKTAVGTSVFIMTFTAFTGALSHFTIGGMPDIPALILCILFPPVSYTHLMCIRDRSHSSGNLLRKNHSCAQSRLIRGRAAALLTDSLFNPSVYHRSRKPH